jgi:hypothetical protein
VVAKAVINGAKPNLAETEADAAYGNEHSEKRRAAPGGKAPRQSGSRGVEGLNHANVISKSSEEFKEGGRKGCLDFRNCPIAWSGGNK